MNCGFCNKTFSTQSSLNLHQKTTKYCLEIQGKNNSNFKCNHCEKLFTTNFNLNEHYSSCKEKFKNEQNDKQSQLKQKHKKDIRELEKKIEEKDKYYTEKLKEQKENHEKERIILKENHEKEQTILKENHEKEQTILKENHEKEINLLRENRETLKETIQKLEAKLEKFENTISSIASKGTTTHNHTNHTENVVINNNNYLDLTKENMKQVISEHLTPAVVSMGQVGLARMVYQKFLKGPDGALKYRGTDPSRQTFEFTNKDGEVIKDVKAHKLTSVIVEAGNLESKAGESGKKIWMKEDGSIDGHKFELNVMKVTDIINLELDNSKFRSELTALTN